MAYLPLENEPLINKWIIDFNTNILDLSFVVNMTQHEPLFVVFWFQNLFLFFELFDLTRLERFCSDSLNDAVVMLFGFQVKDEWVAIQMDAYQRHVFAEILEDGFYHRCGDLAV